MSRYGESATIGVKLVPSCQVEFRGGFHCCGMPNPHGLTNCPNCGKPAIIYQRDTEAVATWPFPANLFFAFAAFLYKLAKRINRWSDEHL